MTKVKTKPEVKPKKRKLTRKQKLFAQKYIETNNATEAAAQVYDVKDRTTAKSIGTENLSKPTIQEELQSIAEKAQTLLGNVITGGTVFDKKVATKEVIDVAKYIHDKNFGKATQLIKQQTINYDVDVTKLTDQQIDEYLKN